MGNKTASRRLSARRAATFLAALGVLVMSSGVALMVAATPANAAAQKYFVCKYVGTPGDNEVLQSGNNPISVAASAIKADPIVVGAYFADDQGRSYVLAEDVGQDKPPVSACPQSENPPPTVCPDGTDKAGQEVPDGQTVEEFCNDETPPTVCPEGTDNAGQEVPDGQTVEEFCNVVVSPPTTVCPDGTDNAGQEVPDGQTVEEFCNAVVSPPTGGGGGGSTVVSPPKNTDTESTTVTTPTVVHAGLAGATAEDMRGQQGLALMFAGMVMLVAAGGLGLRLRGAASRI